MLLVFVSTKGTGQGHPKTTAGDAIYMGTYHQNPHLLSLPRPRTRLAKNPLQVFQVVSLDGWQQVMWHTQDAAGEETWIFFVVVLVIGNAILVSVG